MSVSDEALYAAGGAVMAPAAGEPWVANRIRDAIPAFTLERGGIRLFIPPDVTDLKGLTDDELVEWRAHQRARRDRQAAWDRRVAEHCVCRYTTVTNGDPYEDETYRVDHSDCPVHGIAERRFDDDD